MPRFVLLLRDNGSFPADASPDEIQRIIQRYRDWSEKVNSRGEKLRDGEGRVLRRHGSKTTVTDGPFAESREVLGGYFILEAPTYDDAVKLCDDCPHLDFGSIEIRAIEPT